MKIGIRIFSGTIFRIMETTILDEISTKRVATPIPRPLINCVVTASVGHNPSIRIKTGFFLAIPSVKLLIFDQLHFFDTCFYFLPEGKQ